MSRATPIAARAAFDFVRYGSVWEDGAVLLEALAPAARGGRILSIASAGDNVLALLALEPSEIVAADLSAPQLACLELRIAAFRVLDRGEILELLGARESTRRRRLYDRVRPALAQPSRGFWDASPTLLEAGPIHAGKFERYFQVFRRRVLPLVHRRRTIRDYLACEGLESQRRFYDTRWNTWRWRLLFRVFFSRFLMGRLGRDPEFFAHVEGSVSGPILARTRHAMTAIPAATNPWLRYILEGNFPEAALPPYLKPEHEAAIRGGLDRIRVHRGAAEEAAGRFAGFNLSDIFEYMSSEAGSRAYAAFVEKAAPGARLVYWNMLAERRRPEALAARVREREDIAARLHAGDRAWFYSALRVDEVSR